MVIYSGIQDECFDSEKYPRGRRGGFAKALGWATGARVRIPPSPPLLARTPVWVSLFAVMKKKGIRTREGTGLTTPLVTDSEANLPQSVEKLIIWQTIWQFGLVFANECGFSQHLADFVTDNRIRETVMRCIRFGSAIREAHLDSHNKVSINRNYIIIIASN